MVILSLAGCDQVQTAQPSQEVVPLVIFTGTVEPATSPTPVPSLDLQSPSPPPGETQTPTPTPTIQMCSPLADHTLADLPTIVSSPYDPPPMGKDDRHQGVDFAYFTQGNRKSIEGETVQAILPGRVVVVMGDRLPYGNMILIETTQDDLPPGIAASLGMAPGESLYHLYAHFLQEPDLEPGSKVVCGQPTGQVGATGYNIPVAHLHMETRIGPSGADLGSMVYYDTRATKEEMASYVLWRMSGVFRHFNPMVLFDPALLTPTARP